MRTKSFAVRCAALAMGAGLVLAGCSEKSGTAAPVNTTSAVVSSTEESTSTPDTVGSTAGESTDASSTEESSTEESSTEESTPEVTTDGSTDESTTDDSFPPMTVDTGSAESLAVTEKINAALLTAKDVGEGFAKGDYTPSDPTATTATLPCGQTSTAVMFPNALRTGTTLTKGNTAQLEQAVNMFLDSKTAAEAYDYAVEGLSCSEGDVGGTKVAITDEGDVSSQVGAERAQAWTAKIGNDQGVLVAVNDGDLSLGFTFVIAGGADSSSLPNPLDLVATAVKKLQDAGLT